MSTSIESPNKKSKSNEKFRLFVANKNYSSWSLRPWVLMKELKIPFEEKLIYFEDPLFKTSPSGKVPLLEDLEENIKVWDSLAIAFYLNEKISKKNEKNNSNSNDHEYHIFPSNLVAKAWCFSAIAEMHSGFSNLREMCSMSIGIRVKILPEFENNAGLKKDIARLNELWSEGLSKFGGPFLCGSNFTAADAFFAPVCFRYQTYSFHLEPKNAEYAKRILNLESMKQWYQDGISEKIRHQVHEDFIPKYGKLTEDLRAH